MGNGYRAKASWSEKIASGAAKGGPNQWGSTKRCVADAMAPHEQHAVLRRLLRTYGKRIAGHHFADTSIPCLTSFHYHPLHQITFGKNSHQQAVAKDRYSPDIARK